MSETRHRSPSATRKGERSTAGRDTNSNNPQALRCRVFIGNLSTDKTSKAEVEELFAKYGDITSCSLHNNFGFVQFRDEKDADRAVDEMHGKMLFGKRVDVNLAGLRRKPQSKDQYEGAPPKEQVVPPDMLKPRGRDRSPIRSEREVPYGRPAGTLQRPAYEPFNPSSANHPMDYPDQRMDAYGRREDSQVRDYRRPYEDARPIRQLPRPAIDCEIVSLSKEQTRYAEEVESRLRSIGLVCNIGYPPPDLPILELMDRIARTGTLYAVVVTEQNSQHRSCTLNILHGTRQEHRNMPLDDALSFMARNFDAYLRSLREPIGYAPQIAAGYIPPRDDRCVPPPVQQNPPASLPANEKQMTTEEIEAMIAKLKKEKEEREAANTKPPPDHERYAELSNQLRESADVPPSANYSYDKYPPAAQSSNGTPAAPMPTPAGYYQQQQPQPSQHYKQQPLYK